MAEADDDPQQAFTAWLRDPALPLPPGWDARRAAVYRDLVFNNLRELLAGNFPVIHALLGDAGWRSLVRLFLRDHACQTPLFPEIAREFLQFLDRLDPLPRPFLRELAHYEWVEMALQIAEADAPAEQPAAITDMDGLLDGIATLSPLAWPLAYAWPVHRIGADYQPDAPPDAPTLLLLRRERDGRVRFSELTPLAYRLLERVGAVPGRTVRAHLDAIASEAGVDDAGDLVTAAVPLLAHLHALDVLRSERTGVC